MLVHLPTAITILIDIAAWFVIHMAVSYIMARQPLTSFNPSAWLYRKRNWERNGKIYDRFFRLRLWKKRLPDGAAIFKNGFEKKKYRTGGYYLLDFFTLICVMQIKCDKEQIYL